MFMKKYVSNYSYRWKDKGLEDIIDDPVLEEPEPET